MPYEYNVYKYMCVHMWLIKESDEIVTEQCGIGVTNGNTYGKRVRVLASLWVSTSSKFREYSVSFILMDWNAAVL